MRVLPLQYGELGRRDHLLRLSAINFGYSRQLAFTLGVNVARPSNIIMVATSRRAWCNGMAFVELPTNREGPTANYSVTVLDRACRENGIAHKLTKPYDWTSGQAEASEPHHQRFRGTRINREVVEIRNC
jgi:hypothetical protein